MSEVRSSETPSLNIGMSVMYTDIQSFKVEKSVTELAIFNVTMMLAQPCANPSRQKIDNCTKSIVLSIF